MDELDTKDAKWLQLFDERQRREILFSVVYANEFAHGTDGHNAKLIIANMARTLNALELDGINIPVWRG